MLRFSEICRCFEDCCQQFDGLYSQDDNTRNVHLPPALSAIHQINGQLETLCEFSRKIHELDESCIENLDPTSPLRDKALACHSTAMGLLLLIDQVLIDQFLQHTRSEQETMMANTAVAAKIRLAVRGRSLNNIIQDPKKGDNLFYQLCHSDSDICRQLAINCLDADFDPTPLDTASTSAILNKLLAQFANTHDISSHAENIWSGLAKWPSERLIFWLLEHLPVQNPPSDDQFSCMEWIVSKICERNEPGPYDVPIVERLISYEALPRLMLPMGSSALRMLRQNPHIPLPLRDKLSMLVDEESLKTYEKLLPYLKTLEQESKWFGVSFDVGLDLIPQCDTSLQLLRDKGFPQVALIEKKIHDYTRPIREDIAECREVEGKLENCTLTFDKIPTHIAYKFKDYLIYGKKWALLASLEWSKAGWSIEHTINKTIYHLMMDKVLFPEIKSYESFSWTITAHALINALDRLQTEATPPVINQLSTFLKPLLADYIVLSSMSFAQYGKEIVDRLRMLKVGESLLVPTGSEGHATCLMVTKTGDETFRLTQYNTGQGVMNWHYCFENSVRFQTYDEIDAIPAASVLNEDMWSTLALNRTGSIDGTYQIIHKVLGKGGILLPPSANSEDYEAKQTTGTCAMQCLMALARHQCMQLSPGSPAEKEAMYKLLKTKLFIRYHQDNIQQLDAVIQKNLATVLKKLQAETQLINIAEDPKLFEPALVEIGKMTDLFGQPDIAPRLAERNDETTMARYATLRIASNILCGLFLEHPEISPPEEAHQLDILGLAFAKLEHQKTIFKNIVATLDALAQRNNFEGLAHELFRIHIATPYEELAMEETIKHLGKEDLGPEAKVLEGIKLLLNNFNKFRLQCDVKVLKIAQRLEQSGNVALSQWVRDQWRELAESSSAKVKTFD
jgi:hypothetical protein